MEAELEDFDSLIGTYLDGLVEHEVSSIISVKIVEVHSDNVLVDLGDKAEGLIDIQEFFNAKGYISVSVGDMIDVEILGRDDETELLGTRGFDPRKEATIEIGREAMQLSVAGMIRKAKQLMRRCK